MFQGNFSKRQQAEAPTAAQNALSVPFCSEDCEGGFNVWSAEDVLRFVEWEVLFDKEGVGMGACFYKWTGGHLCKQSNKKPLDWV